VLAPNLVPRVNLHPFCSPDRDPLCLDALLPSVRSHCRFAIMYGASPFQQAVDQGASLAMAVMK
jgi:hypothetical protein